MTVSYQKKFISIRLGNGIQISIKITITRRVIGNRMQKALQERGLV